MALLLVHCYPLWPWHVPAIGSLPEHTPSLCASRYLSPSPRASQALPLFRRSSVLTCGSTLCSLTYLFFLPLVASPLSHVIHLLSWLHPGLGCFLELPSNPPGSHKIHTSHCLTTAFLRFQVPRLFTFNFLVLHLGPPARRPSSLSCTICCSYLSPRFSFCRSHCSSLRQLFNFNAAVLKLPYITDDITDDTIYHISYITYITD